MRAYVGIDESTGRYYAVAELPQAVQYGATPEEAWVKLDAYLREHHNMALTEWRPFPRPETKNLQTEAVSLVDLDLDDMIRLKPEPVPLPSKRRRKF